MGKVVAVVILLLVLVGGGYLLLNNKSQTKPEATTSNSTVTPTTGTTAQSQNTITLTQSGFSPATLTIKAGQTVTWTNKSGEEATVNSDPHPVHTNYAPLNLGQFADGQTLTLTFSTPGTYGYHNHLNPSERGTIIVQ